MLAPSLLMGAKTADVAHFEPRPLLRAMALTVFLGTLVSLWASLALPYYNGGGNSLQNPWMYKVAPVTPLGLFRGRVRLAVQRVVDERRSYLGGAGGRPFDAVCPRPVQCSACIPSAF